MAQNINVPGDQPTIIAAIAAATDGTTITITDSGTYSGNIVVNKRINLVAASGQSPTIVGNGTSESVLTVDQGGSGSKIGSLTGGRITVSAGNNPAHLRTLRTTHTSGEVTFENLLGVNPSDPLDQTHVFCRPEGGDVTMRKIEINGGGLLHLGWDLRQLRGKKLTLDRIKLYGMRQSTSGGFAFYSAFRFGNLDVTQSEFICYRECFIIEAETPPAQVPTDRFTVNLDRCYFQTNVPGNWDTLDIRPSDMDWNISQCVIVGSNVGGRGIFLKPAENCNVVVDHCDIRIPQGRAFEAQFAEGRNITITNNNLFGNPAGSENALRFELTDPSETYTVNWNNYASSTSNYDLGPNDIPTALVPDWYDIANHDFRYNNTILFTGGENGTSIGTNCNLFDIVNQTDPCPSLEPPPPPSSARTWESYM